MAGPYNPPNPYGSYFSFGEPAGAMNQSFGPFPYGMLHPSAMASMGVGSGGFNPTPMEYLAGQVRNQYQQRFLAETLRSDPRTQNITTALLNQMSASSQKSALNLFGGRGNFQEMVGMALALPGVSSLVGGSPYSLGQGALAAATGGMKIGGVGMFAEGAAGIMGAQQIVQHMTKQFYLQGGGSNVMATQGLNRDQIGGIMALGSAQGAFAGLNMGTLSTVGSKMTMNMDQGTLSKISQFTKSAAKALSGLIDIYGDASIVELADKAQKITGMRFDKIGNAQVIQQRLALLRQAGQATGIDTATMFDMSAMGVAMGQQMGLVGNFGGNVASNTAVMAANVFRANQGQAGSFRTATPSIQEIHAGLVRDMAGMSRDPIGRRRMALQLGIETGHFTGSAAETARGLMRKDGLGAIGDIDEFMGNSGIATDAYIKLMGGPEGMMNLLSEGGMDTIREGFTSTVGSRAWTTFRTRATRAFGPKTMAGKGGQALLESIQGVGKETLDKIFQATRGGWTSDKEVAGMLQEDPAGRMNTDKYLKTIRMAVDEFKPGVAAAMHASLQQGISTDPYLSKHAISVSGQEVMAKNRMSVMAFSDGDRGQMRLGLFEGLLKKMTGDDPRSSFIRAAMDRPGSVIGLNEGITLPTHGQAMPENVARMTASTLINGLGTSAEGKGALAYLGLLNKNPAEMTREQLGRMNNILGSQVGLAEAFKDFQLASDPVGNKLLLQSKKNIQQSDQYRDAITLATGLGKLVGGGSDVGAMLRSTAAIMKNDPEKAEQAWKQMISETSSISLLSDKKVIGKLKALAEASPSWANAIAGNVEAAMTQAEGKDDWKSRNTLAKGKGVLDILNDATGRKAGGEEGYTLNGQLDLVGDALILKEVFMNKGKK